MSNKPTIGIVTQPTFEAGEYADFGSAYVAGGYVKWIEMAGVQAFYVPWDSSEETLRRYIASSNGFLLPGGPQKNTIPPSDYFQKIARIYHLVLEANKHFYFPLIGICQGFEELIWSATNFGPELCVPTPTKTCVNGTDNVLLACKLTTEGFRSNMLNNSGVTELDQAVKAILQTPITPNFHSNAVFPSSFGPGTPLGDTFNILATSRKDDGPEFVSMIEGKTLPIYGLQWHTSLQVFEWSSKLSCLTHDPVSILVMQYLANFVAGELRRNNNVFPPGEFESIKFSNQKITYTENLTGGPVFENAYFFGPPVDTLEIRKNWFSKLIELLFGGVKS